MTIEALFAPPDVHDTERQTNSAYVTFAVAALAFAAETLLMFLIIRGQEKLLTALALHGIISLLLLMYVLLPQLKGNDSRFAQLLLLTTLACGPFGAGGTLLAIVLCNWNLAQQQSFQEWFASLFPQLMLKPSQKIFEDLRSGRDDSGKSYSIVPFLDVMTFGDELQKRHALEKMAAHFYPGFAPAFRKALSDSSNMIRVQAATAIAKVESEFQSRAIQLTDLKEKHMNDPRLLWALAELYDDYSHTGLIDPGREETNRQQALAHYEAYLKLKPEDNRASVRIGRLLMRAGDNEKACDWFRRCIDEGKLSDAMSDWYSEALFNCGRYEELRRWCASRQEKPQGGLQPALAEALALWKKDGSHD